MLEALQFWLWAHMENINKVLLTILVETYIVKNRIKS